ncbi:multidrug effflux MFS transporter [Paraburkholderia phenazinium]|uniref:Bcr/CflA family efflux transporter n=1 Tax=Paraburkholderia phenazinium TaxID=60549 RepID=A0A1G8M2J8_9BURK|nr:multidrug effflux MFS transporter [Paraburkholderia phenazinium]SDI62196.1 MFS transporter, DHA1 family, multidrug/chloramphenicol efflux transport protein [Paraburkholderia phenazinium]
MSLSSRSALTWTPLLLAMFELAVYLSNDMFLPALPVMRSDLSAGTSLAQQTLTLWFLGGAVFNLLLGPVSDRFGRKPVLLAWGVLFCASSLVCATTSDIAAFLTARFLQGATVAAVAVCGYATIHELMDETAAVKTLGWMSFLTVLAPAFGPTLGGIVVEWWAWRPIFGLIGAAAAIIVLLIAWRVPESHPAARRTSLQMSGVIARYRRVLGSPAFMVNTASAAILFGGTLAWIVSSPHLLVEVQGYSPVRYGLTQLLLFIGFMIGAAVVNGQVSALRKEVFTRAGITLAFTGGLLMLLSGWAFESVWPLLAGVFVYNVGNGLTFAIFQRMAMDGSAEPAGAKMAMFATAMVSCATLSSLLASFAGRDMWRFVALMFTVAAIAVAAIRLSWRRRRVLELSGE